MANAVALAERATSDLLSVPDWAINEDLCNIIKADPRQGKDALKIIKKKLGHKNPKMQIIALFVLDALTENCGANIFHQMIEGDILGEIVKIVKMTPDLSVREKILTMINTWQSALGGIRGKFPQYYDAYKELKSAGVEFPPRVGNNLSWFTPPPTYPLSRSTSPYEDEVDVLALETDASGLSLEEIKNAERHADVLTEVLAALDPNNSQGVKDELIVDLVDQCRTYQKRVTALVNNTQDEDLLCGGLLLYDRVHRVLRMHDNIASGTSPEVSVEILEDSVARLSPFKNDEESDGDFSRLKHRSSQGLVRKPAAAKTGQSKDPFSFSALFTRIYGPEETEEPLIKPGLTRSSAADDQADPTVKNHLNGVPAAGYRPPPPSRFNQRQQFLDQHITRGSSHSSNHSAASSENLLIKSTNTEQEQDQGSMYKYVVDLANAKAAEEQEKHQGSMYKYVVDLANAKAAEAKAMRSS